MRCVNLQGTSLNTYSASLLILLILNFSKRIYTRLKKSKQSNRSWVKTFIQER